MSDLFKENCMLENQQIVKDGNKVKVKGVFQRADTPNKNGRVYTRELWENILKNENVVESLQGRNMLGELDHPDITETSLQNVSHIVTDLKLQSDNSVIGEAEILDTPNGQILQKLMEAGVKVGISSRGYVPDSNSGGKTREGHFKVPESFVLKTFDFVVDPSTPGAFPSAVSESHKTEILQLVESAGDKVNPAVAKSINESLSREGKEGDQGMPDNTDLDKELKLKEQTILSLEKAYKDAYTEKARLEAEIEALKEEAKKKDSKKKKDDEKEKENLEEKLNFSIEMIEELRDRFFEADKKKKKMEKDSKKQKITQKMKDNQFKSTKEQLDLLTNVVEELRDRYLVAEGMIEEIQERYLSLEKSYNEKEEKLQTLEESKKMEDFIIQKAQDLNMTEAALRKSIEGSNNIEEAKDKLLDVRSYIERNHRSLPVGQKTNVTESSQGNQNHPKSPSRLAQAISRMR